MSGHIGEETLCAETLKEQAVEQLDRLLSSPAFSHSRRFPLFLRFVTEETLEGRSDLVKERTLGIQIFGRQPDYDTASDPVVRVTAAEIRKRLDQYYREPGREDEFRIVIPKGTYVPQFHKPHKVAEAVADYVDVTLENPPNDEVPVQPSLQSGRGWLQICAAILVALTFVSAGWFAKGLQRGSRANAAYEFVWSPFLRNAEPVLICVADRSSHSSEPIYDSTDFSRLIPGSESEVSLVAIDDLRSISRLAGTLEGSGKPYRIKGQNVTTLDDLRTGPTVLVGAFDNIWTLRLTRQLRYHFHDDAAQDKFAIVDGTSVSGPWNVNRNDQLAAGRNYRDFAIVARFTDSTTGKLTLVAAGIGRGGTVVAGEFLTNPEHLAEVYRLAGKTGRKANFEVVISTQIIGGQPGKPKIEAAEFW